MHDCVRLGDDDLQWLYDFVSVGPRAYIYRGLTGDAAR